MATPFNSCFFRNGIMASEKLRDYEHFLITVLFAKAKEMAKKKLALLRPLLRFSAENTLRLFKIKSSRSKLYKIYVLHEKYHNLCFA